MDVLSADPVDAEKRRGLPRSGSAVLGRVLLTQGILPFAALRPASLFALLLQRSGYFLLAVEEKVTRSPQASGSSALDQDKKREDQAG